MKLIFFVCALNSAGYCENETMKKNIELYESTKTECMTMAQPLLANWIGNQGADLKIVNWTCGEE